MIKETVLFFLLPNSLAFFGINKVFDAFILGILCESTGLESLYSRYSLWINEFKEGFRFRYSQNQRIRDHLSFFLFSFFFYFLFTLPRCIKKVHPSDIGIFNIAYLYKSWELFVNLLSLVTMVHLGDALWSQFFLC